MKTTFDSTVPASRFASVTILVLCTCFASGATHSQRNHTYEGFTEPVREIKVAASESARVAEVAVRRGATVARGDVIMDLDKKILEASLRVAQAKANAKARIEALRIEQEIKTERYEKIRRLHERGAGSAEETRRAKADSAVAELNVQSALEDQVMNELAVEEIQARIEQRRVRSPINGVVTDVLQEPGEFVSLNEPQVATVVQLDTLRVTFFIATDLATQLREGQELTLELPGLAPPKTAQQAIGRIEHLGVVTEADSGRVRLDVLIDNPKQTYRSGVRCLYTQR